MNDATSPTLILGGGFVGLFTALHLSHQRCKLPTILIDLIRQAAYIEMLPPPVRNFKATAQWLTDEIFHRIAKV